MAKKRITSQDVADLAKVSRTTVSLVLNEVAGASIPAPTREKVRQAAKELGYVPNATAQALATRRSKAIGLVMTRSVRHIASDSFLPQLLSGLLEVIKKENFRLLIEIVDENANDRVYFDLAQAKHIDGMIILTPRTTDSGLRKLVEMNIPVVLIGGLPDHKLSSVQVDDRSASKMAVEYLLSLGHTNIACIINAHGIYGTATLRLSGYKDALAGVGLPYEEGLVRYADFDPQSGFDTMQSILKAGKEFTAVFIASDNVAMGAKAALRQAGFRIPEDVSIVGFDDIPWAAHADPPLTTVQLPAQKIATKACLLLLDIIRGEESKIKHIYLDSELIIRKSCQEIAT